MQTADALVAALAILAALVAWYPLQFHVAGIPVRIRSWPRVAVLAAVVAFARHWLDPTPSIWSRIAGGWLRLRARATALGGLPWRSHLPLVLALAIPTAINGAIVAHGYDGDPYLRGDCPYYYWTARALFYDHGLNLSRQLPGGWQAHVNQISWSLANAPVPKHPVVLSIVSLPFVIALGEPGALVFNLLQVTVLLWVLYELACAVARPAAASAAVIATFAFSFLPHYVWNYSPDVCATVLLMGGTLLLARRGGTGEALLGGLLLGAACVAKYPLILFLPGSLLLRTWSWKAALAACAGLALPFGAFALMNVHLFGSPFVTSYDRIATLVSGEVVTVSQRGSFDLPIGRGMLGQLFDPQHGLLATSPVTLVALLGVPLALLRRPRLAAHLVVGSIALFLLYSTYDQWNASHYGNRFLMPLVAALTVPLAAAIDRVARRQPAIGPHEVC